MILKEMELLSSSRFQLPVTTGQWYRIGAIPRWYEVGITEVALTYDPTGIVVLDFKLCGRHCSLRGRQTSSSERPTTTIITFDKKVMGLRPQLRAEVKAVLTAVATGEYRYLLVGDTADNSLHILSRQRGRPSLSDYAKLKAVATGLGYDFSAVSF
jgi:lipocalin